MFPVVLHISSKLEHEETHHFEEEVVCALRSVAPLQHDIHDTHSAFVCLQDLLHYIAELQCNFDSHFEYAYGETPFYSLSKALLNAYTRVRANEVDSNVRIYSVCPGNFQSPMSTEEEVGSQIPIDNAASAIIEIALDSGDYLSGRFYRNGAEIQF